MARTIAVWAAAVLAVLGAAVLGATARPVETRAALRGLVIGVCDATTVPAKLRHTAYTVGATDARCVPRPCSTYRCRR
jgi:hypothetical protein